MKNLIENQKKLFGFTIFLTFSLFASILLTNQHVFAFSGNGAGTSDDPYKISNCAQWLEMADNLSASYIVSSNIDCTGTTYTPIGTSGAPFTGSLDGGGWEISGVSITSGNHIGLFGYTSGATIKNLDFASSTISGSFSIGGIVADATSGTISNIHSTANITASGGSVGGLVGIGHDTLSIEKSSFNGTISAGSSYVGGLIGRLEGNMTINDSYAAGFIGSGGSSYMGGFAGAVLSGSPTISRSYSTMNFTDIGTYNGGFIGGFFGGAVIDSFSASDMTVGAGTLSGGMFGVSNGTTTRLYFDEYLANRSLCIGSGAASCTRVNTGDATPDYFKNNSTNAPLSNWNFTSIWSTSSGEYPQLSQIPSSEIQCEMPTTTQTAAHVFCDVQSIGDVGSLTWYARYRIVGVSGWTSFTPADPSSGTIDITGLKAGTDYEVSFKYVSSLYGTSYWISTNTTTKASSGGHGNGNDAKTESTITTASATTNGYGPVNEDIFAAEAIQSKIIKRTSNTDPKPIYDNPASTLKPTDPEKADNTLRNILIASGAIVFLALIFNFLKPLFVSSGN